MSKRQTEVTSQFATISGAVEFICKMADGYEWEQLTLDF